MKDIAKCAACKYRRMKCRSDCIFSPHFPGHDTKKYAYVHRVYCGSNVKKMLLKVPSELREITASALYFEAKCRIQDPVLGSFGIISKLNQQIQEKDIAIAKLQAEIANYNLQIPQDGAASNLEVTPVQNIRKEQFVSPTPYSMMPGVNMSMEQIQWPKQAPMMVEQNISVNQFQWCNQAPMMPAQNMSMEDFKWPMMNYNL